LSFFDTDNALRVDIGTILADLDPGDGSPLSTSTYGLHIFNGASVIDINDQAVFGNPANIASYVGIEVSNPG